MDPWQPSIADGATGVAKRQLTLLSLYPSFSHFRREKKRERYRERGSFNKKMGIKNGVGDGQFNRRGCYCLIDAMKLSAGEAVDLWDI